MVALKRRSRRRIKNNKAAAVYKKASKLFMAKWWKRLLVFPVKRIWLSLYSRLKSRKNKSGGILKLRDDVQTCEYEDVQVMWEMLQRSESELMDSNHHKNTPFWSVFVWSNSHHNNTSSSSPPTSQSADTNYD